MNISFAELYLIGLGVGILGALYMHYFCRAIRLITSRETREDFSEN